MENVKDIPDLEFMDIVLFDLVVEAFGNRKNNTLAKKIEAARPALEIFVANEIFELSDASGIDEAGLAKYFNFKDGPRNNFSRLLRDVAEPKPVDEPQQNMHTPSPTTSISSETTDAPLKPSDRRNLPDPSSSQVDVITAPQAIEHNHAVSQASILGLNPSVFSYTRSESLPDVSSLFDTPVEIRDLRDRINVQVYSHGRKALNRDRKAAAQVVLDDLVRFSRHQSKNKNVVGWEKLNIRVEHFQVSAEALIQAFPCTASVVVDAKGKPTDVFYRYDKSANPTQSGILFEKFTAQKKTEANQAKRRSAPSTTKSPKRQKIKEEQPQLDTSANGVLDAISDPLNSGLLTIEANKMELLELYTMELIEKLRGKKERDILMKCYGLFAYNGSLVSCEIILLFRSFCVARIWHSTCVMFFIGIGSRKVMPQ